MSDNYNMVMSDEKTVLVPDCFKDIYLFENFLGLCGRIFGERITGLDMSEITFVEPYSMVSLLMAGRQYLKKFGEKLRLINVPAEIAKYLVRMEFFKKSCFNVNERDFPPAMYKKSAMSKRVIELTGIPGKERECIKVISSVIGQFREKASYIIKNKYSEDNVNFLITVISEICQNIYEHSMDSGFLAMQTYSYSGEQVIQLVVSDSGIGIEGSFGKRSGDIGKGSELIKRVVTEPISSKRDFGYGLCQVYEVTRILGGNLFIRSDGSSFAFFNKNSQKKGFTFLKDNLAHFDGTQISLSI